MSPRSNNDKAETTTTPDKQPTKKCRLFSYGKRPEKGGTDDDTATTEVPVSKAIAPVGFTELFRFARIGCLPC
jgi:hypothetical protein